MANIRVCARFRPAISEEEGEVLRISRSDSQSFTLQDKHVFSFDRAFYEDSEQSDVYEFLARPIVRDAVKGINGTIITYGETGAGKTYTMEGTNIMETDNYKKGLLPRVVTGLFEAINLCGETAACKIKLSMVEIYMERVRDLLDLSKDNIQIKEHEGHGMLLRGVPEMLLSDGEEALKFLSSGIANRAVGEISSRSHCIYMFTVEKEVTNEKRVSTGKLILVDLAGSEMMGTMGRAFEEAKAVNLSLSALGNVINALTFGQRDHILFRDSKLTMILQDSLRGSSQIALLCCCSPGLSHLSETLSTLRFGTRSKHIKESSPTGWKEEMCDKKQKTSLPVNMVKLKVVDLHLRILEKLRGKLDAETVKLIGEEFESVLDGIIITPETMSSLENARDKVLDSIAKVRGEKLVLKEKCERMVVVCEKMVHMAKRKCERNQARFFIFAFCFLACAFSLLILAASPSF